MVLVHRFKGYRGLFAGGEASWERKGDAVTMSVKGGEIFRHSAMDWLDSGYYAQGLYAMSWMIHREGPTMTLYEFRAGPRWGIFRGSYVPKAVTIPEPTLEEVIRDPAHFGAVSLRLPGEGPGAFWTKEQLIHIRSAGPSLFIGGGDHNVIVPKLLLDAVATKVAGLQRNTNSFEYAIGVAKNEAKLQQIPPGENAQVVMCVAALALTMNVQAESSMLNCLVKPSLAQFEPLNRELKLQFASRNLLPLFLTTLHPRPVVASTLAAAERAQTAFLASRKFAMLSCMAARYLALQQQYGIGVFNLPLWVWFPSLAVGMQHKKRAVRWTIIALWYLTCAIKAIKLSRDMATVANHVNVLQALCMAATNAPGHAPSDLSVSTTVVANPLPPVSILPLASAFDAFFEFFEHNTAYRVLSGIAAAIMLATARKMGYLDWVSDFAKLVWDVWPFRMGPQGKGATTETTSNSRAARPPHWFGPAIPCNSAYGWGFRADTSTAPLTPIAPECAVGISGRERLAETPDKEGTPCITLTGLGSVWCRPTVYASNTANELRAVTNRACFEQKWDRERVKALKTWVKTYWDCLFPGHRFGERVEPTAFPIWNSRFPGPKRREHEAIYVATSKHLPTVCTGSCPESYSYPTAVSVESKSASDRRVEHSLRRVCIRKAFIKLEKGKPQGLGQEGPAQGSPRLILGCSDEHNVWTGPYFDAVATRIKWCWTGGWRNIDPSITARDPVAATAKLAADCAYDRVSVHGRWTPGPDGGSVTAYPGDHIITWVSGYTTDQIGALAAMNANTNDRDDHAVIDDLIMTDNDMSKFDGSVNPDLVSVARLIFRGFGMDRVRTPFGTATKLFDAGFPVRGRTPHGVRFNAGHMVASGVPYTSMMDSLISGLTTCHSYCLTYGVTPWQLRTPCQSMVGWHPKMRIFTTFVMGDDNHIVTDRPAPGEEEMALYGFTLSKANISKRLPETDFCSRLFWPATIVQKWDNTRWEGHVLGVKLGRYVYKTFWDFKLLLGQQNNRTLFDAYARGVALGLAADVSWIPVVRAINARVLSLTQHLTGVKAIRDRDSALYNVSDRLRVLISVRTLIMFCERYHTSPTEIQSCENYIRRLPMGSLIDHPLTNRAVQIDLASTLPAMLPAWVHVLVSPIAEEILKRKYGIWFTVFLSAFEMLVDPSWSRVFTTACHFVWGGHLGSVDLCTGVLLHTWHNYLASTYKASAVQALWAKYWRHARPSRVRSAQTKIYMSGDPSLIHAKQGILAEFGKEVYKHVLHPTAKGLGPVIAEIASKLPKSVKAWVAGPSSGLKLYDSPTSGTVAYKPQGLASAQRVSGGKAEEPFQVMPKKKRVHPKAAKPKPKRPHTATGAGVRQRQRQRSAQVAHNRSRVLNVRNNDGPHTSYFKQTMNGRRGHVEGKDFLFTIATNKINQSVGSPLFDPIRINPNMILGSRLSAFGGLFENFYFTKFIAHYARNANYTREGMVAAFFDMDSEDSIASSGVVNVKSALSHPGGHATAITESSSWSLRTSAAPVNEYWVDAHSGDDRLTIQAVFNMVVMQASSDSVSPGSIWIEYEVEFYNPKFDSGTGVPARFMQLTVASAGTTGTNWFGGTRTVQPVSTLHEGTLRSDGVYFESSTGRAIFMANPYDVIMFDAYTPATAAAGLAWSVGTEGGVSPITIAQTTLTETNAYMIRYIAYMPSNHRPEQYVYFDPSASTAPTNTGTYTITIMRSSFSGLSSRAISRINTKERERKIDALLEQLAPHPSHGAGASGGLYETIRDLIGNPVPFIRDGPLPEEKKKSSNKGGFVVIRGAG